LKPNLGFIGLGFMGTPMVSRLLSAGYNVWVWNRTKQKLLEPLRHGAFEAHSINELVEKANIVMLCLTDSKAVGEIVFGSEGISASATSGQLVVDFSSIDPQSTISYSNRLKYETGINWIDAPVSGGIQGAANGTLAIMAGGLIEDIDLIRPIVKNLSQQFTRIGDVGAGQVAKLCNQIIVGSNIVAIAECIRFAEKSEVVDAFKLPEALKGGWADSQPFQTLGPRFAARSTQPTVGYANTMLKDLNTAIKLGKENDANLPMAKLAAKTLKKLDALGLGESDIGEIMTLFN
tara:strand:- start:13388 stop:14260 length:873 start_codon:yes stop_codon:yes gene_type:complete